MADPLSKPVVGQMLEAAKSALAHLSELKLRLAEVGRPTSGVDEHVVLQLYSRVRRVREYLRRCMSAYPMPEQLELSVEDCNLLCSCMVFELSRIEKDSKVQDMKQGTDGAWFEKRKSIFHDWAVQLATEPIEHLPNLWNRLDLSYSARQAVGAVREKLTPSEQTALQASGILRFGNAAVSHDPAPRTAAPNVTPQSSNPVKTTMPERATNLVDTSRIHDYRLRLTMVLDIRAYHRCVDAEDFRLAIVLLGMILEGVLVDHGMQRYDELDLQGSPKDWPFERIVESILEGEYGEREHAAFVLLQRSQRLLRPTSQLEEPIAVNKAMLQATEALVRKVGSAVGVSSSQSQSPSSSLKINW